MSSYKHAMIRDVFRRSERRKSPRKRKTKQQIDRLTGSIIRLLLPKFASACQTNKSPVSIYSYSNHFIFLYRDLEIIYSTKGHEEREERWKQLILCRGPKEEQSGQGGGKEKGVENERGIWIEIKPVFV